MREEKSLYILFHCSHLLVIISQRILSQRTFAMKPAAKTSLFAYPAPAGMEITGAYVDGADRVFTPDALAFVATLARKFTARRDTLLAARAKRQNDLDNGATLNFPPETAGIREGNWQVGPIPEDLQDRRVEITGPVERKMIINALNSGAKVFMADFEDSLSPVWEAVVQGQINLHDAVRRSIYYHSPEGKEYRLNEKTATLIVRPRGWHLDEKHARVDGKAVPGALLDFGLYFLPMRRHCWMRAAGRISISPRPSIMRKRNYGGMFFMWPRKHSGSSAAPSRRPC
jgi:malate synthase